MAYLINRYLIDKIAITMPQLRKATTKVPNLIRRKAYRDLDQLWSMGWGAKYKAFADSIKLKKFIKGNKANVEYMGPMTDPIRKKIFIKGNIYDAPAAKKILLASRPRSPEQKEFMNRLTLLHERLETRALNEDKFYRNAKRLASTPVREVSRRIFSGHASPSVILRESNAIATSPKLISWPTQLLLAVERKGDETEKAIRSVLPSFRFGKQRLSRHAIKNIAKSLAGREVY